MWTSVICSSFSGAMSRRSGIIRYPSKGASTPSVQKAGAKTADLARRHSVSEATIYNCKAKDGGLVSEAKRLRAVLSALTRRACATGHSGKMMSTFGRSCVSLRSSAAGLAIVGCTSCCGERGW